MSSGSRYAVPYVTAFDTTGIVSPGALLNFYISGTSTPQNTYSDYGLTAPNSNPVPANGAGLFPNIFMTGAAYKVVLTDSNGDEIWTADPVYGSGVESASEGFNFTTTTALLSAFGGGIILANGTQGTTAGRTAEGDGGGGLFYYDSADSTTADNGGTVRVDGQSRRWKYLGNQIFATLFGAKFDGTTDDTAAIIQAITTIYGAGGGDLWFPEGTSKISRVVFNWAASVSVNLYGAGQAATIFSKIGTDTNPAFDFSADTGVLDIYSEFCNFAIVGNGKHADGFKATTLASFTTRNLKITECDNGFHALGALKCQHYDPEWSSNNIGYLQRNSGGSAIYSNLVTFYNGSMRSNTSWGADLGQGAGTVINATDFESNGTAATATTGHIAIRATVDDETGYAEITLIQPWLEAGAAGSTGLLVEAAAGLHLTVIGPRMSGGGATGMNIGAIQSLTLLNAEMGSVGDVATIAATTCTIIGGIFGTLTDTSESRQYQGVTTSGGVVTFGTSNSGTAQLTGGAVVISYNLRAGEQIFAFSQSDGGTPGWLRCTNQIANTSFTITSSNGADTSHIGWLVVKPV